jgi:diguanylate cyclase (GGDEF)-like protein
MSNRVLIADDCQINRFLLSQLVAFSGGEPVEAATGSQALQILQTQKIDVAILDILMPEPDGMAVLHHIKEDPQLSHIAVIVVSALDKLDPIVRCVKLGAEDYLTKPYEPTLLSARLKTCFDKTKFLNELVATKSELQRRNEDLEEANLKLAEFNRKLEEMAFKDFLTGLPNRRFASDQLTRLWAASTRREATLSCIMVDVDHFKKFNDTMGHECGDLVLSQVAEVVQASVRLSDVAARFGGEEFIVICPDTSLEQALQLAHRIRQAVAELSPRYLEQALSTTVSLGVVERREGMTDWSQMVALADEALYEAKRGGRNRVCLAGPSHLTDTKA